MYTAEQVEGSEPLLSNAGVLILQLEQLAHNNLNIIACSSYVQKGGI